MAQPRPLIQTAAQVLARYLRHGYTPEQARTRVERESGELTPGQYQSAIRYAQRLEVIRQAALNLEPNETLRAALGGSRPPGAEVDVPVLVLVYMTKPDPDNPQADRAGTVYVRARWDDTIESVRQRALEDFLSRGDKYPEAYDYGYSFPSGFLFTGGRGNTASQP
jgi:hypothetical protein